MTSNNRQHPYPADCLADLIEPYVLGALEEDEREVMEAHIDVCPRCTQLLAGFENTVLQLADSAPPVAAPAGLRAQVMEAVATLPPVFVPPESREPAQPLRDESSSRFPFSAFALPLAATLVIGLLTASLIMNVVTTGRLNSLQQERLETNARLEQLERGHASASAGISQLAADSHQKDSALRQVIETSYLMARPYTQPLLLQPTRGSSDSEGVLLVTGDGRKAILMLANMEQPLPTQSYNVWLSRNGQHMPVGQITVDASGWGTMAVNPPESLFGFDWMNLTMDKPEAGSGMSSEMVLQTRIISPGHR